MQVEENGENWEIFSREKEKRKLNIFARILGLPPTNFPFFDVRKYKNPVINFNWLN